MHKFRGLGFRVSGVDTIMLWILSSVEVDWVASTPALWILDPTVKNFATSRTTMRLDPPFRCSFSGPERVSYGLRGLLSRLTGFHSWCRKAGVIG